MKKLKIGIIGVGRLAMSMPATSLTAYRVPSWLQLRTQTSTAQSRLQKSWASPRFTMTPRRFARIPT